MDRASVDRAACLAGCVPAAQNRRICASLQRGLARIARTVVSDYLSPHLPDRPETAP